MNQTLTKIKKKIRKSKTFLIATHVHPEADALGAQLALYSLLARLGKKVIACHQDPVPAIYHFLPWTGKIISRKTDLKGIDVLCVVDCSERSRIGRVNDWISGTPFLINIDHHESNASFGDLNWVDARASSASEMIYELFLSFKMPLKREEALLLYAGLMTDTGSFRYSNTTARTHAIASDLLKYKISVRDVYHKVFETNTLKDAKAFQRAMKFFKVDPLGKTMWFTLTKQEMDESSNDQSDNLLNFGRSIDGIEVVCVFKELKKRTLVRVNLRSQGKINVCEIARHFGGGGHACASGCLVQASLGQAQTMVMKAVQEAVKEIS